MDPEAIIPGVGQRERGMGLASPGVISIFRQSIMRGRAVIQAILSDEILCKIEMSFRQNKEATIRSVEIF